MSDCSEGRVGLSTKKIWQEEDIAIDVCAVDHKGQREDSLGASIAGGKI